MKTLGPRGTYSRTGRGEPALRKRPDLLKNQKNSAPGVPPAMSLRAAEGTEPGVNSRIGEPPNGAEIDPLRVMVWGAFAVILVAGWAAILWFFGALP